MALADLFVGKPQNCSEILNGGSALYIAPLFNCADEPYLYTLQADVAGVIGDTTISIAALAVSNPNAPATSIRLRKGARLRVGVTTNYITVAEDFVLSIPQATPGVLVPCEPLTAAVAAGATITTWGMVQVLSPSALPVDRQSQMVNRTDLSFGIQGAEVITKITMSSQVEIIARIDDAAYWDYLVRAENSGSDVYVLVVRGTDARHYFGRAKVANMTDPGAIEEINRPTFQLSFQTPFAAPTLFQYLTTAEQAQLNLVRQYAGLPALA
jgi:hypothetical protein